MFAPGPRRQQGSLRTQRDDGAANASGKKFSGTLLRVLGFLTAIPVMVSASLSFGTTVIESGERTHLNRLRRAGFTMQRMPFFFAKATV